MEVLPKPGILDKGRLKSYISIVTLLTPCLHPERIVGSVGDIVILQPEVLKHLESIYLRLEIPDILSPTAGEERQHLLHIQPQVIPQTKVPTKEQY